MSCSHRNYWTNSGLAGYYAAAQCEAGPTVDYDYGKKSCKVSKGSVAADAVAAHYRVSATHTSSAHDG